MALPPGTRLGSCEILAPLGAGGMGEVYRARDGKLDREVAVKVLKRRQPLEGDDVLARPRPRAPACYLVRNALSLQKLMYLDGHKAVLYRSRMNPSLGRRSRPLG